MELSWFKSLTNTNAVRKALDFDEAVALLTTPVEVAKKEAAPMYSPALYNGNTKRSNANVIGVSALVVDFDNQQAGVPTAPADALPNLPDDIAYIWHSTFSATEEKPKWRLIIPFSRPVLPAEWGWVAKGGLYMLGNDDGIDRSTSDISRAFFVMSHPPGGVSAAGFRAGEYLDPQYLLDQIDAPVLEMTGTVRAMPAARPNPCTGTARRAPTERQCTGEPGTGRNNRLRAVVAAMYGRGESIEDVVRELLRTDAEHTPPLFADPAESQYAGIPPHVGAMKFAVSIISSIETKRAREGLPSPFTAVPEPEPAPAAEPDFIILPDHVLNPGGYLQVMTDWINATSIRRQPVLALAATIAAFGTILGRKVKTETNLRTNLYVVGIGETSCGKEHARQCVKELFSAAGCEEYIGPENLASDSGLLTAVHKQESMLLAIDEIGWLLKSVTSQYAKSYMRNIAQVLMQLHSSAGGIMMGKSYADKERKQENIQQPNVCLYGTSVPSRFYAALTRDEVEDGFIPRLLIFESDDPSPKKQRVRQTPPPAELVKYVQYWHNQRSFKEIGFRIPVPREIVNTESATTAFAEFETYVSEQAALCRPRGTAGLWGKTEATAMQLAMIYAVTQDAETTEITDDAALWAIDLVKVLTHRLVMMAEKSLNTNQYEADVKKVLRIIYEYGKDGVSRKELVRRCQWVPRRVFDEVLVMLEESEQIRKEVKSRGQGNGKSPTIYYSA